MKLPRLRVRENVLKYRFEFRHVTILFIVLLIFQLVVSFLHKSSLQKSLASTQDWYQQDSAEKLANLATTSLELLLESQSQTRDPRERDTKKLVQSLNIILSQQILHQNVQDMCILVPVDTAIYAIDEGQVLYAYMFQDVGQIPPPAARRDAAIGFFRRIKDDMRRDEQIHTIVEGRQTFHVFVPFAPRGEFVGAVYMKNTPDFGFITREIISSYDETSMSFSALILFGLLAMFYISSYTLRERNVAQQLLFDAEKEHLAEHINHQKELSFTKRIYHTHHKAEKVTGFIKEDLRSLTQHNIEEVKDRFMKYANFIARVIYDMKWYDPPVQTIRGPMFRTNVNDVIRFLVTNMFSRVSGNGGQYRFNLDLDDRLPSVSVNEYVVWEAIEPIIQNAVEHAGVKDLVISITTRFVPASGCSTLTIADNGAGLPGDLLERNDRGVCRVFEEHTTTTGSGDQHSGYGCYIAHEIATQRCGWELEAENGPVAGSRFIFTIHH